MPGKMNDKRNKTSESIDTDAALEQELSRERAEGQDSIGDGGKNRTLSGSSSWETLPENADAGERTPKSDKQSGTGSSKRGKK